MNENLLRWSFAWGWHLRFPRLYRMHDRCRGGLRWVLYVGPLTVIRWNV